LACKGTPDAPVSGSAAPTPVASASEPQTITTGVSDTEIVIGQPAAFSGASAGLGIEMWRGATAAFSEINDSGGIAGRKIKLVVADDGYDAEKAAPAVVDLVAHQHAFVLFGGVGTPTIARALPVVHKYFNEAGLFYFANFTGAQPQRRPPNFQFVFNVRASYYEETKAIAEVYTRMHKAKVGIFMQDDAYGIDGREGLSRALEAHGATIAAEARYPRGQEFKASMASQVQILRDAGVDAVVMVGAYQACAGFVRDARRAGWDVPIDGVSFVGADQLLTLLRTEEKAGGPPLATNLVMTQVVPLPSDPNIPAVVAYRAAIDKYDPVAPPLAAPGGYKSTSKYSFGSLEGYISARALASVLQKPGHELTRKSAYQAAEAMGTFELGLGVPAELSATRHQVLDNVWFTYVTNDGWKSVVDPATVLR
jgi:ABC-type branched-subunit amino acid transport system substrate-binding protein